MPIPTLSDYPLPEDGQLPSNAAGWQADPRRAALLIHDMQRYFLDFFPAGATIVTHVVERLRVIRDRAHELGIPVFYTAQPGAMTTAQRGLLRDIWGPGMSADPAARQIVPALAPQVFDTVLTKWRYSAFHSTDLAESLSRLGRDQLIVGGVYGHVGVLTTLIEAFSRDIETFLVADAFADFSASDHWMTVRYAAKRCAVVLTADSLVAQLDSGLGPQLAHRHLSQLDA